MAEGSPIRTLARTRRIVAGLPGARLDVILIAVVAALALGGVASVLMIGPWVRVVAPLLDLVLDTVTTLVTLAVAALAWIRYRERGEPVALFQAAAFVVLAMSNGTRVVLEVTGLDAQTGSTLAAPGQGPLYVFTLTRLLAAGLLWSQLAAAGQTKTGHIVAKNGAIQITVAGLTPSTMVLIQSGSGNPFRFTSVAVGATSGTLAGTIDLQSLLGL